MPEDDVKLLNAPEKEERLTALRRIAAAYKNGGPEKPPVTDYVNNHIHTTYSFSPYSPAGAVYTAWKNGLATAGIVDHDTVAGAEEFIEAGEIIGMVTTVGAECRCDMSATPFAGRLINSADQKSIAYMTIHGIPHQNIAKVQDFLTPYREKRNARNRAMVGRINGLPELGGITLDFDSDVAPLSEYKTGGAITERHLIYALSLKLIENVGKGANLIAFLEDKMKISVTGGNRERLSDAENGMYGYFLLNALKGEFLERFYIQAADECPPVADYLKLCGDVGAISAYPYLGDVTDSVTGDKKALKFEDDFLDELVEYLERAGFDALTFMPARNTGPQLQRVMGLCRRYGLFQISGEDINSPFQPFICTALDKTEFKHLITSTWALIGHERAATGDQRDGMFSPEMISAMPGLKERTAHYAELGKASRIQTYKEA